jgi:uncharacterized OB-fold protein
MPSPVIDDDTREYWEACRDHRLVVQRCMACGEYRYAPAPVCFGCSSFSYELVESRGSGKIYTWTVIHRPVHPAVVDTVPYNVIVVRLDDCGGALITSNLVDAPEDGIAPGVDVVLDWDDHVEGFSLPVFRLAR